MEATRFDTVLGKIEKFAAAAGGVMHRRIAKIGMCLCFVVAVAAAGSLVFSSSFLRALLGRQQHNTHI